MYRLNCLSQLNWENFYKESNGNQWPDVDIIKHSLLLNSQNSIDVFVDIGSGTGSNVRFSIEVFPHTLAIDCSPTAICKLEKFYKMKTNIHTIETICSDIGKVDWTSILQPFRNKNCVFVDCTTLQHISPDGQQIVIASIANACNNYSINSSIISKSLTYESQNSSFKTFCLDEDSKCALLQKFGNITNKSITILNENDLIQKYLTCSLKILSF